MPRLLLLRASAERGRTEALSLPPFDDHRQYLSDRLTDDQVLDLFAMAIETGSTSHLELLLREPRAQSPAIANHVMRMIVEEGSAELARVFLTSRPKWDESIDTYNEEEPILHVAVEQDNAELVWVLLQHGHFDVNQRDQLHHRTALHVAVEWDSLAVQQLLVQAGADINASDIDGFAPLHVAAHHGYLASLEFLLTNGATIDQRDNDGNTPLHIAARDGHIDAVNYLVQNGADVHATDTEGRSVLHVAAFVDESAGRFATSERDAQTAVVAALLAHGADHTVQDSNGDSVIKCARRSRFDLVVELLRGHQRNHSRAVKRSRVEDR